MPSTRNESERWLWAGMRILRLEFTPHKSSFLFHIEVLHMQAVSWEESCSILQTKDGYGVEYDTVNILHPSQACMCSVFRRIFFMLVGLYWWNARYFLLQEHSRSLLIRQPSLGAKSTLLVGCSCTGRDAGFCTTRDTSLDMKEANVQPYDILRAYFSSVHVPFRCYSNTFV